MCELRDCCHTRSFQLTQEYLCMLIASDGSKHCWHFACFPALLSLFAKHTTPPPTAVALYVPAASHSEDGSEAARVTFVTKTESWACPGFMLPFSPKAGVTSDRCVGKSSPFVYRPRHTQRSNSHS